MENLILQKQAHHKEGLVRYEAHRGNSQKEVITNKWDGVSPKSAKANPAGGGQ